MKIDIAKDLVLALRDIGLEAEALQGAYYKGLTLVTEDQHLPLWKLRLGGHRWKEALEECEEVGGAYKQAKETPGQVTRAEVKESLRDFNVEDHVLLIKLHFGEFACHRIKSAGNMSCTRCTTAQQHVIWV